MALHTHRQIDRWWKDERSATVKQTEPSSKQLVRPLSRRRLSGALLKLEKEFGRLIEKADWAGGLINYRLLSGGDQNFFYLQSTQALRQPAAVGIIYTPLDIQ